MNNSLLFLCQKDNWMEVPTLFEYLDDRPINPFVTFLYEPFKFSLLSLPSKNICEIVDFYLSELDWKKLSLVMRVVRPLIAKLSPTEKIKFLDELKEKKDSWLKNFETTSSKDDQLINI